ncbi:MAG: porin [Sphingobacteriales bacterium]|nr:porin [Sphingobacteriales bacterium]
MIRFISLAFTLFPFAQISGQDSSGKKELMLTGFIDFYYQYDFDNPASKDRPAFLFNHKRHNEFNINLALLKLSYAEKKIKANLGLMAGTYPQYNLSTEPRLMQYLWEANIGYAFPDKISIDAGILPSHIGLETAISKDNWNLSRSILAENTPYYETGIKLNYVPNEKWATAFLVSNGWQNIKETNSGKAIGTQIQFRPSGNWLFNSSTFIGNEKPDSSIKQVRLFHNFYTTYAISEKINAALLFDVGTEKKNSWYGVALLLQYIAASKVNTAFRAEYYKDKNGIIVSVSQPGGFQTTGFAWNLDFYTLKNISFRVEGRYLHSINAIFTDNGIPKKNNFSLLGSMEIYF